MPAETPTDLALEHKLFSGLLELAGHRAPDDLIENALDLIVALTASHQGYLVIRSPSGEHEWSATRDFAEQDLATVRKRISGGILARALAEGKTIHTSSALQDDRFRDRESVKQNSISAVICAPFGESGRLGAVYLQGREGVPFAEGSLAATRMFSERLAPLVERLVGHDSSTSDPTAPWRERLEVRDLLGRSPAMAVLLEQVASVAPLDVDLLLTGPTGTGKSVVARAIARNSRRRSGPIVEINCAALPENLIESELFGVTSGAHSTAHRSAPGKVASAEGGTLVLDEVSELPMGAQAKLLRFLQERKYYPLGSTQEVRANVRVVAATNVALERAVEEHRFREDLFYRLNVVPVRLPTLEERREDIPVIMSAICSEVCDRHGFAAIRPSPHALAIATEASWPGNVRQLKNAVEAAVIRAQMRGDRVLASTDLLPDQHLGESTGGGQPSAVVRYLPGETLQDATLRFQRDFLEQALQHHEWNMAKTARSLEVARSHLYALVSTHGLKRNS